MYVKCNRKGDVSNMKTVLIVEDHSRVALLIQSYLKRDGYNTLLAFDGIQAIKMFDQNNPDLLILDVMLPGKVRFGNSKRNSKNIFSTNYNAYCKV